MRHRVAGNRINMPEARRRAAIRSMVDGLFLHEHIQVTLARAKVAQSEAEKLIGIAKLPALSFKASAFSGVHFALLA